MAALVEWSTTTRRKQENPQRTVERTQLLMVDSSDSENLDTMVINTDDDDAASVKSPSESSHQSLIVLEMHQQSASTKTYCNNNNNNNTLLQNQSKDFESCYTDLSGDESDDDHQENCRNRIIDYNNIELLNSAHQHKPPSLSNGAIKEEELNSSTEFFIKCPQCQKGCQSFQALKEHTEIAHADLTTSSENTLSVSSALSPTSLGPSPLGRYGCSQCSSSFSSKEQLEKHELLHSPNAQVSCKICHKTFANVYRLQRHMISHDESAVLRKFKCTECDKAFKFKHHLKEHIRIHSGEKPFECGNCGKRFSHSGSYSSHMTSKKCLVMNLKLGRTRGALNTTLLDKNLTQNLKGTKRPAPSPIINNNISSSPNHNSPYMPIMPKYADASAAAALFQSQLAGNSAMTPFYLTPHSLLNAAHPISPYSASALGHLLEQLQQQAHQHHQQQQQQQQQLSCSSPVSRSSLMDTTESNHHHVPKIIKSENDKMSMTISEIHHHQTPEDFDDLSKSNASECGELVMDEDSDVHSNEITVDDKSNDKATIEVLKRFSETVIKESPTMNTIAESANSTTTTTTTTSQHSPVAAAEHLNCDHCNGYFKTMASFDEHDCIKDCQSEGLAAKLEAALTPKSENGSIENTSSAGEDHDFDRTSCQNLEEMDSENYATTDHVNEDGKKVRVRSLISEDQLRVLKDKYTENPRPKREELEKIALRIGFPVRVVQVWFQNTRARDRREGRLIPVPFTPTAVPPTSRYSITLTPLNQQQQQQIVTQSPHHLHHEYISEQPLDLSVKKGTFSNDTSPSSSPKRPLSVTHSESHDEVVNLSHKTYKEETVSPTSYLSYQNHFQGSNSSDGRQTPTTLAEYNSSRLAQILAQPAHKLTGIPGMGIVPMDHLLQFGAHDLPSITQLITNRMKSLSPISVHHSPHHDLSNNHQDEESLQSKRAKVHQMLLKSIGTAAGIQEPEAEGQFQCDQCDKAFSKQSSLARHKYEHSGQRPHKCDECTKAFKHKHHLTEHKRLHSGEKPFQCKKCLKRFSHSGSYSQHMNHRYSYCKPYRE